MRAVFLAALLGLPISYKPSVTVSVGTSATLCAGSSGHTFVEVYNTDTAKTVEVSFDSTLTYGKGRPVPPGQFVQYGGALGSPLARGQLLYCVTSSGTADARVQEGFEQ